MAHDSTVARPSAGPSRRIGGSLRDRVVRLAARASALCSAALTAPCFGDIPNNSCSTAAPVPLGSIVAPNLDASENNLIQGPCGLFVRPAWYSFTAPGSGELSITALPQNETSLVVLAIGPNCESGLLNCSAGTASNPASLVVKGISAGQTVKIVVGVSEFDVPTNIQLTLSGIADACGESPNGLTCCLGGNWRGCSTPLCCSLVCSIDPFCCGSQWDGNCSNIARTACGTCNYPDCDGNGVMEYMEYGIGRAMLVNPDGFFAGSGQTNEADYCPMTVPNSDTGLILTGDMAGGAPRLFTVCTAAVIRTVDISDTYAIVQSCGDGFTALYTSGLDGVRVAASGPAAPARAVISGLEVNTNSLTVGRASSEGTIDLVESSLTANSLSVVQGAVHVGAAGTKGQPVDGSLFIAGSAAIEGDARLSVLPTASAEFAESLVVRGLLDMWPESIVEGQIIGPLPSSWLRTAGSIQGSVLWGGCIRPRSSCSISGDLTLVATETGPNSRYLWDSFEGGNRVLTVGGTAKLAGTLFIDARNTPVGTSATILRAGFIEGAFDSVQVFGLPPQFAMIVAPVQGGAMMELRARVVTVGQLLGYGEGSNIPLELTPQDSVAADFNADGIDDLAISLSSGGTTPGAISVFRGTGQGLVQVVQKSAGLDPRGIAAADFDSDARTDLVVALAGDDAVRVLKNTTDTTIDFVALTPVPVGDSPVDVATLDFFPDGASLAGGGKDVLVAVAGNSTFVALKNNGGTVNNSGSTTTPSPGGIPTSVGGGDVDNDRVDDGVGGSTGGNTVIPGGSGAFAQGGPIFLPSPHPVTSVVLVDCNADGVLDIVSTLDATGPRPTPPGTPEVFDTLSLVEFRPTGFTSTLFDYRFTARSLARGDFDADGDQDLAFASRETADGPLQLRVVRNDMSALGALLTRQNVPAIGVEPRLVGTISIDGNGEDVLAFGPGTTDTPSNLFLQRFLEPAIFGDLNADGIVDAVDLNILLANWALPGPSDLDGNGETNAIDLGLLLDRWSGK